jgi:predicted GNAT superfamily acetyltransferase
MSQAWELAHRAAADAGVALREFADLEDADRIRSVLIATWGDEQVVPREMLRALAESGNVPYGAFDGEEMVGYVLGWAGVDARDGLHVHSHMLATLPDRRHRGVGYALKLAQRAQALDQGIDVVRWTFDPLVARNGYFNLHKLGVVIDRFERSFYGEMGDAVNRGDRSDRFVVRWDVREAPGPWSASVSGDPAVLRRLEDGRPERLGAVEGDAAIVEVPTDHESVRRDDPALARRWRDEVAFAAEECLGRGLLGVAFDRERSAYVFARTFGRAGTDVRSVS